MTRDDIFRLCVEAGLYSYCDEKDEAIYRFAALVAAAEREACADIVENADTPDCGGWTTDDIAAAIRARSDT
jgi:hypothetical protein